MKAIKFPELKIHYVLTSIFYLILMVALVRSVNHIGVYAWGLDFLTWWPMGQSELFGIGGMPDSTLTTNVSGLAIELHVPGLESYLKTHWLTSSGLSLITLCLFLSILATFRSMLATVDVKQPFDVANIRRVQLILILVLFEVFVVDYWKTESMKPVKNLINQMSEPLIITDSSYQNADGYAYVLVLFLLTLMAIFRRGVVLHKQQTGLEKQLYQKQKLEAVGTLASGVGHDFNNILTSIIGYAELAKSEPKREAIDFALERVLEASYRAKRLTQQIRAIGGQQHFSNQETWFDLKNEVNELLLSLAPSIPENIQVITKFDSQTRYEIYADPTKIYQVLLNLSTNALQAMGKKPGLLSIDIYEKPNQERAGFCLSIEDTGQGMSTAQKEQIFEPYFTTREQVGGTGLGLSLCHSIVESYQGKIDVSSRLNYGSCFTVWLPKSTLALNAEEIETISSKRILLIDDDKSVLTLLKRKLTGIGHSVESFDDCQSAYDAFCHSPERFDLIISDLNMPKMTGIQFYEKVHAITPDKPFILITGTPEQIETSSKLVTSSRLISKPIAFSELQRAIVDI